jgi:mannose-1-phosphate guanylyltransferase/mannose-6-phosphate isomerase
VSAFVEKPDAADAEAMVKSGTFLWNSGMFVMRASVWLEQIEKYRPDIAVACSEAHANGSSDGDFLRPGRNAFESCPVDSIDYAVMERAAGEASTSASVDCAVVPMDAGWSDIGAWSALWEDGARDAEGNVLVGDVRAESTTGSLLIGTHRLLAAVGLEDVIAVETPDAVLVASKDSVQDVKGLVTTLRAEGRPEQENHRRVHRPWGSYETVDSGPGFQVKRLTVNPGAALSLQVHHRRAEHWVVVSGTARVVKGDERLSLNETESIYVPVGVKHRLENPGDAPVEIIEVQTGDYLGEDDIVRLEDRYHRDTPQQQPR